MNPQVFEACLSTLREANGKQKGKGFGKTLAA
jgi:hypothetical protein